MVWDMQVEKMVARLTDRMEELAARPADGNASISAHVLVRPLATKLVDFASQANLYDCALK